MSLTVNHRIKSPIEEIVPISRQLGYAEAFNLLRGERELPSNLLLDRILARPGYQNREEWKRLANRYPIWWTRDLVVYPESDGVFRKGKDVVDSYKDRARRTWLFSLSSIPQEALDRKSIGLLVCPEEINTYKDRVVVEAGQKNVIILENFLQKNGWGMVDKETGIPLSLGFGQDALYPERYLRRTEGVGVRPIVRSLNNDSRLIINASETPDMRFGVGFVDRGEQHQYKTETVATGIMERFRRFILELGGF